MLFDHPRHLRLQCRDYSVDFLACGYNLRSRLNAAFVDLVGGCAGTQATLFVRDEQHGWVKVCDIEQRYPIIKNPLLLNGHDLWRAVMHTLAEAGSWPSEEEKQRRKQERARKRRAETAEARRGRFYLV